MMRSEGKRLRKVFFVCLCVCVCETENQRLEPVVEFVGKNVFCSQ